MKSLKRRIFAFAVAAIMAVVLTGCGDKAKTSQTEETTVEQNAEQKAPDQSKSDSGNSTETASAQGQSSEASQANTTNQGGAGDNGGTSQVSDANTDWSEGDFSGGSAPSGVYYDLQMSLEIFGYVNAERAEAGLRPLDWNDSLYNFACKRCVDIMTDFSHSGAAGYGENILWSSCPGETAYSLHMMWHNSPGHYSNYMNGNYTDGCCAIYYCNGAYYGVENFDIDPYKQVTEDDPIVGTFEASNGDIVYIYQSGKFRYSSQESLDEYFAYVDAKMQEYINDYNKNKANP